MHPYAAESGERERLVVLLALIGLGLAWAAHQVLAMFDLGVPWWIDAPSVSGTMVSNTGFSTDICGMYPFAGGSDSSGSLTSLVSGRVR